MFSPSQKRGNRVGILYLPWWDLGTASIVSDVNGAGWPQTRVNC